MNIEELKSKIKPVDQTKPYVFISYSKRDFEKVYPITIELQNRGVNLWIDKELDSSAGFDWREAAFSAMRNRKCCKVLFFMSKNSFLSIPVMAELQFTLNNKVKLNHNNERLEIAPICIEDNMRNMGDVINACSNESLYEEMIGKDGLKKFQQSLNEDRMNDIDEQVDIGGLIGYVFDKVFNGNKEITVVSEVDSLMTNIPSNAIDGSGTITQEHIKTENNTSNNEKKEIKTEISEDKQKNIRENNNKAFEKFLTDDYFNLHKNDKDLLEKEANAEKFYVEFANKFAPEKLKELSGINLLRKVFLNDEGSQDNICSYLEYGKDYMQFGSIKGGTALKHGLYYSAKDNSWKTGKPPVDVKNISEEEAILLGTRMRDNIVKACEIIEKSKDNLKTESDYAKLYDEISKNCENIHKIIFVKKYFHMIYRDLFPCMFSGGYIRKVAEALKFEKDLDDFKYIGKIETKKNEIQISNRIFAEICYKFFEEENFKYQSA